MTPYKIAVLVYVVNDAGDLLLLHRRKPPNKDLFSPIGGKLEQAVGESPHALALREIEEEISLRLPLEDLRLLGIVSERAYTWNAPTPSTVATHANPTESNAPATAHWLMFCFEVLRPLNFPAREMDEGRLEWHPPQSVAALNIPQTDREIIWPLVQQHARMLNRASQSPPKDGIFCVHIDCTDADHFKVIRGA